MELNRLEGFAPGDALTIAGLYEEYEEPLHRYAVRLARDADRADDLVQETMVRAMAHLALLEQLNRYQRQAWLYRVLRNRFIDEERAHKRDQELVQRVGAKTDWVADPTWMVLSPDLLDQLPDKYAEVLQQHYLLGMTSEEIGRSLGLPAATVRSRLHLAIKWIRTHQPELE